MATADLKESRTARIIAIVIAIILLILFVSGCTKLIFRSFQGSKTPVTDLPSPTDDQVKGVSQTPTNYHHPLCGVEFEYDPNEWQYIEASGKFIHSEAGSVTLRCEDIGSVPESPQTIEIDKVSGKLFTQENTTQVIVNLPGGNVEWIMEGDQAALEKLAQLIKFRYPPQK